MERSVTESAREDKVAATRARLAELAARFLDRSTQDIASMQGHLVRVAQGDADALGHLRQLAHRMVGTGATLGFEQLAQKALLVESLAESVPNGKLPDDAARARMLAALEGVLAECQRARGR